MARRIDRDIYLGWADQVARLGAPQPTTAETMSAERVAVAEVAPTMDGALLRVIAQNGGSIDLMMNAAQVIHLFRCLHAAGREAGWMNDRGMPMTEPPLSLQDDPLPLPPLKAR